MIGAFQPSPDGVFRRLQDTGEIRAEVAQQYGSWFWMTYELDGTTRDSAEHNVPDQPTAEARANASLQE